MLAIDKKIFGKTIAIQNTISSFDRELLSEFSLYQDPDLDSNPDIDISITDEINSRIINNNPAMHYEYENGFGMKFGPIFIQWDFSTLPVRSFVCIQRIKKSPLHALTSKILSMEYTLLKAIGQILHEFVLVPMTYFFPDIAPVHGSSVIYKDGVIIFGGTGGVGKTSTLLSLKKKKKIAFYSDDHLILNRTNAYPNFAYPKIYAYNVINERRMEKSILKNYSMASKLHWYFWKRVDQSKVRRRISPLDLFDKPGKNEYPVSSYLIFNRCSNDTMHIRRIESNQASALTLEIMKTELAGLNNHFYWHNYNRSIQGNHALFSLPDVFNRWKSIYTKAFHHKKTYIIDVPITIDHSLFKSRLLDILETEILT